MTDRPRDTTIADPIVVSFVIFVSCLCSGLRPWAQAPPDRSRPPALAPTPQLDLPAIQKRTLSNGLAVWLVESHEVPIVQVNLVVRAGAGDDPAGKFGTASLTAAMLDEGAGTRSALEIADAVEFLGASLTTTSSFDSSAVRLNVPVERLRDALPAAGRRHASADVSRDGARTAPAGAADRAAPGARRSRVDRADGVLADRLRRACTGTAPGAIGTEATLKALSTGDLSGVSCRATTSRRTPSSWSSATSRRTPSCRSSRSTSAPWKARRALRAPPAVSSRTAACARPDLHRGQARGGTVADPDRVGRRPALDADYFPLLVLNTMLGGSFTSRLNQNLREEHGYAYGASSGFDMRLSAGPVRGGGRRPDRQDRRSRCASSSTSSRASLSRSAPTRSPRPRTTSRWGSRPNSSRRPTCRGGSRS